MTLWAFEGCDAVKRSKNAAAAADHKIGFCEVLGKEFRSDERDEEIISCPTKYVVRIYQNINNDVRTYSVERGERA